MSYSECFNLENGSFRARIEFDSISEFSKLSKTKTSVLLKKLINEFKSNILQLLKDLPEFVKGSEWPMYKSDLHEVNIKITENDLFIGDHQVMQKWQAPMMNELAMIVTENKGDVLEIGFGLGIASDMIQKMGVNSHTIVESHPDIYKKLQDWAHGKSNIRTIKSRWEDLKDLGFFDAILFDPYPMSEKEFEENWKKDVTYANQGFAFAANHLKKGGAFTYYTNEIDSLSRNHQRELLKIFSSVEIKKLDGFKPPQNCQYWWAPSMIIVKAVK